MIRFPKSVARRISFVLAIIAAPLVFAGGAQATAMFSGSATVSLTVTGIENITTPGGAVDIEILGGVFGSDPFGGPVEPEIFSEGAASGSASSVLSPELTPPDFDDPTTLGIGDSLSIALSGSGSADVVGYVDVLVAALGVVTIENFSGTDEVEISFLLDIMLEADASLDDALIEDAVGGASVYAESFFGALYEDEYVEADGLYGPPTDLFSTSVEFSLIVGAEGFDDIQIFVDAGGFAEALPAPGMLVILLAGAAMIGFRRRMPRSS